MLNPKQREVSSFNDKVDYYA